MKTWTTYRMADGTPVWGEYAWVENEEYFDGLDEPVKVVKETWQLVESSIVLFEPSWWEDEEWDEWYETEED